jgi:uncharacterized membrane protein YeaQ/YmgE (transglycosylase-associated protein family)
MVIIVQLNKCNAHPQPDNFPDNFSFLAAEGFISFGIPPKKSRPPSSFGILDGVFCLVKGYISKVIKTQEVDMFLVLGWLIYGLITGCMAKWLHPGEDPVGFVPTIGIGIVGSYIGGLLNFLIGANSNPFSPSGIAMGIVGALIFCWAYRYYRLNRFFKAQGRMPENIIRHKD